LLGNLLGDLDGPFQILQRWRSLILYGLDENYFYNSVEMYKTINSEKLLQLAHTYFKPELLYEVVVI
jgi:zinc protease